MQLAALAHSASKDVALCDDAREALYVAVVAGVLLGTQ
mgnify:CR=1 FL=1|jgi:hypothetical protein|tara:strand:- start:348 stop:461 length:114 start_codon:yes stop_codon:yes gene_type:complete